MSSINWSSPTGQPSKPSPASSNAFGNLSIKPSTTPQNGNGATKGSDSFANLVSFGRDKQNSNLSLAEQQQKLEEQRRKDEEERLKKMDALFGGGAANNGFWNALDSKGGVSAAPPAPADDDDILAGFGADVPVDRSSHYPPPSSGFAAQSSSSADVLDLFNAAPPKPTSHSAGASKSATPSATSKPAAFDPFDDFEPQNLPSRDPSPHQPPPQVSNDDDFDILGDLAKPVSEFTKPPPPQPTPSPRPEPRRESPPASDPRDGPIAEIMDMGFTAEQAKQALAETDTGLDVQGAVSWLLEQAHRKSRPASAAPSRSSQSRQDSSSRNRERLEPQPRHESRNRDRERERSREPEDSGLPAWARGVGRGGQGEKDLGAVAAELSGTIFKSATQLWSSGRTKMERAVAEFKADLADGGGDPSQPKWMRERQIREELERNGARGISRNDRPPEAQREPRPAPTKEEFTDEAMMLEMGSGPPQPPRKQREERREERRPSPQSSGSQDPGLDRARIQQQRQREMEAAIAAKEREMREREQAQERARASMMAPDSASRKAKLSAEPEAVYVSRNRRRPPPAASSKPATPEPDLLGAGGGSSNNPFARDVAAERQRSPAPPASKPTPSPHPTPAPRPPKQQRQTVAISPDSLTRSNTARASGTDAFKRGDYTAAQAHYTSALTPIPDQHPLRIVLLSNRSLCTVKLGDPKNALIDVEAILLLIGPHRGEDETIAVDGTDKDMKDYWTKAISRKAECLEQLEKWADAKGVWEEALSGGATATAMNGKRRCEAALKPKAAPKSKPVVVAKPPPKPVQQSAKSSEAVQALRQQNAAQERQEQERLELHDKIHDRIGAWKNGKEGNLRALLAGLDTVLWEGSGWKKVGMAELLIPAKCKIAYMKGIAKVHPDKIRPDATTEQKMISGAVFSLLNDSWDKFKAENGL
ncbi:hypothetical protein FPQ18DRAFT_401593 [Pyronema domesticum]|nr:hypothetical protein FPQ18DRAFT_401593 [Pyronema domesticum]